MHTGLWAKKSGARPPADPPWLFGYVACRPPTARPMAWIVRLAHRPWQADVAGEFPRRRRQVLVARVRLLGGARPVLGPRRERRRRPAGRRARLGPLRARAVLPFAGGTTAPRWRARRSKRISRSRCR